MDLTEFDCPLHHAGYLCECGILALLGVPSHSGSHGILPEPSESSDASFEEIPVHTVARVVRFYTVRASGIAWPLAIPQ